MTTTILIIVYVLSVILSRAVNLYYVRNCRPDLDKWYIGWCVPVLNTLIFLFYGAAVTGEMFSGFSKWKGDKYTNDIE